MHKVSLAIAVLGTAVSAFAQNCNGAPAPATILTQTPWAATHYMGSAAVPAPGCCLMFDATISAALDITSVAVPLYDYAGTPNPDQTGSTGPANIYTCPTTRVGNELIFANWTLRGSGTYTVAAGFLGASTIALTAPINMLPGSYGVAIELLQTTVGVGAPLPVHPLVTVPASGIPAVDTFWTITNPASQNGNFTTGAGGNSVNVTINYTPIPSAANWVPIGQGCYNRPRMFYEHFLGPNLTPDIENTSITLLPSAGPAGPTYIMLLGVAPYVTPVGTPRNSVPAAVVPPGYPAGNWDDALDTPITLPFAFPFPGGSTNDITIGSNGRVFLANVALGSHAYGFYNSFGDFQNHAPRFSAFDGDLDPVGGTAGGAGNIYYETDNVSYARISWNVVEEWTPGGVGPTSTFQITLFASGQVDIAYGDLGVQAADVIVGFSSGNGQAAAAGPIDLSASNGYTSGDGAFPAILGMSAPPVLGTTPNIVTNNFMPGTGFEFFVAGLGSQPPLDLTVYGLPNCNLYLSFGAIVATFLVPVVSGTATVPFAIPLGPTWLNVQFFFQAAPFTPGLNPAGILTTNAICAKLGT